MTILLSTKQQVWWEKYLKSWFHIEFIFLAENDQPLRFEDAVEQQPDLDEENRRRFPQIPALAFHPWEGIEQEQIDDDDDDDDDEFADEHEMDVLEDNLNREQAQLNHLQGRFDFQ